MLPQHTVRIESTNSKICLLTEWVRKNGPLQYQNKSVFFNFKTLYGTSLLHANQFQSRLDCKKWNLGRSIFKNRWKNSKNTLILVLLGGHSFVLILQNDLLFSVFLAKGNCCSHRSLLNNVTSEKEERFITKGPKIQLLKFAMKLQYIKPVRLQINFSESGAFSVKWAQPAQG